MGSMNLQGLTMAAGPVLAKPANVPRRQMLCLGRLLTGSFRERACVFDEFEGFFPVVAIGVEGGVERAMLLKGQDGHCGIAQQSEVLSSFRAGLRDR